MRGGFLVAAVLAAAVPAGLLGFRRSADAQEKPANPPGKGTDGAKGAPPAKAPPAALQALDRIIRSLRANDGPLALGVPAAKVKAALPGAAFMATEYMIPLGGSFLDPSGKVHGSIRWTHDDDAPNAPVDTIQVILLTGDADRAEAREVMKSAGKATGLDLEPGEGTPDTWWDVEATKVDLWVALGDGIVALDAGPTK